MTEQRRMSTAVAEDLASRRRKQQNAALLLVRRYDELIDVAMNYWTAAGHQWRNSVLAARDELKALTGEVPDAGRKEAEVSPGQPSEQRRRPARNPWD